MSISKKEKRINNINKRNSFLFAHVSKNSDEILANFSSSLNGLSNEKVEEHKEKYGLNVLSKQDKNKWYKTLFNSFFNAFSIILVLIATLYVILDQD